MGSIKKNFMYNTAYQILALAIPLITTPYLSRVLCPEGIGEYSYRFSIARYFLIFIMLGLENYGNRAIAKVRDSEDKLRNTFWSIYKMQFVLGISISSLYLVYCFNFSNERVISLVMFLYVLSATFDINWFFFGLEKFKMTVTRNFVIKIISTVCIFAFVKDSDDLIIYSIISVVGMVLSQLVLWPFILINYKYIKVGFKDVIKHLRPNSILFLTVLAVSIYKIMDKIMLGFMTTTTQVGFFESSEKIISVPTALITSLGIVMLPRMSNMVEKKDSRITEMISKSLMFVMFIATSMCFGIMGIAKEFVPLFYGKGYEECIRLFEILLPSCIFLAFANVIRTQYLLPQQMDKDYVKSAFLGAITNLILNLILISNYGAIGAAVGTLCAEVVVCMYQSYAVRKALPIVQYVKNSMPFVISGMAMYFLLKLIQIDMNIYLYLVLKIFIGIFIYLSCLFLQCIVIKKTTGVDLIKINFIIRIKK